MTRQDGLSLSTKMDIPEEYPRGSRDWCQPGRSGKFHGEDST